MKHLSASPISISVSSPIDGNAVLDVSLYTNGPNGTVKVVWVFFESMERYEEIHVDLATALIRVGVLVSTTEHERVREYTGSDVDFARRVRDFIVMTTA